MADNLGGDNAVLCRLVKHREKYTEEYENAAGHVQADAVCTWCGRRRLAWTGPKADKIRELGYSVPTEAPSV